MSARARDCVASTWEVTKAGSVMRRIHAFGSDEDIWSLGTGFGIVTESYRKQREEAENDMP